MKNSKIIVKPFIFITIASVLLIGIFLIIIFQEKIQITKNGKDFEAKCISTYTKGSRSSHHKLITVYVFEVTSPNEIKGETFEKAKSGYSVGKTYKGKYIDNGEEHSILHDRYEYQILE
mgnify:CR=1 FL=1